MLLQHKGAFQELFESAQDLQTVPTNFFVTALWCLHVRRATRRSRNPRGQVGAGVPGIARYCLEGRLVGREGIVAHVCANTKESISRGESDFLEINRFPATISRGERVPIIFPRGTCFKVLLMGGSEHQLYPLRARFDLLSPVPKTQCRRQRKR